MSLVIDCQESFDVLDGLLARMTDVGALLGAIGAAERDNARERIESTKDDPLGAAWLAWRPSTAAQREQKGNAALGILYDDGTLLDSIQFNVDGYTVSIGTPLDYAQYLQGGTEKMAAREFLGWGAQDLTDYQSMIEKWIFEGES